MIVIDEEEYPQPKRVNWNNAFVEDFAFCAGDACMGDVVMFEQNVYDINNAKGDSTVSNKGKQGQEKQHRAHHIQQNENQIPKESQYVHGIRSNLVEQAAILERQQWPSNYKKPKIAEHRAFQALKPWNLEHRASSSQYPHYFSKQHYPWNDSYHPHYTNQNQHYTFFETQACLYHQGCCHYGENCRYLHYG
ncbi:hypothetical protein AXF42_Ash005025 [Apostasia shenzhenica]|uniref:C3H1-type domain-containing protein n=1 Tax=Apostasia shenzhenica TaxID=1088818 RepID=A0A2I0B887_9ASPA|nr:hypothetical protein AXF42_Ash005025 [Apostasia shenzhenica]